MGFEFQPKGFAMPKKIALFALIVAVILFILNRMRNEMVLGYTEDDE